MVKYAFNHNIRETEAGGFLSLMSAWSTKCQASQAYKKEIKKLKKRLLEKAIS